MKWPVVLLVNLVLADGALTRLIPVVLVEEHAEEATVSLYDWLDLLEALGTHLIRRPIILSLAAHVWIGPRIATRSRSEPVALPMLWLLRWVALTVASIAPITVTTIIARQIGATTVRSTVVTHLGRLLWKSILIELLLLLLLVLQRLLLRLLWNSLLLL